MTISVLTEKARRQARQRQGCLLRVERVCMSFDALLEQRTPSGPHSRTNQRSTATSSEKRSHTPNWNLVEHFFRELRRAIEGRVYPTLQAKQEGPGAHPEGMVGEPQAGTADAGIREVLTALPTDTQVIQS